MHYGDIITNDTANGPGIRLSLFVSGCTNHCKGCFNEETWNFNYGEEFTKETMFYIIEELSKTQYDGLTILGGDPLHPKNREQVAEIISIVKQAYPLKNIWVYTGYLYKELKENKDPHLQYILSHIDVLVDGPFIEELKDLTLDFRGSSNQRILLLKE